MEDAADDPVGQTQARVDFFGDGFSHRVAHAQVVHNQIAFGIGVGVDHMGQLHIVLDRHNTDIARGGANPELPGLVVMAGAVKALPEMHVFMESFGTIKMAGPEPDMVSVRRVIAEWLLKPQILFSAKQIQVAERRVDVRPPGDDRAYHPEHSVRRALMGFVPASLLHSCFKLFLGGNDADIDWVAGKAVRCRAIQGNMRRAKKQTEDTEKRRYKEVRGKYVRSQQSDCQRNPVVEEGKELPNGQINHSNTNAQHK